MPQQLLRNSTSKVAELFQMTIMELANLRRGVVTAEALLIGLIEQRDSIVIKVLDELRKNTNEVRRDLLDAIMVRVNQLPAIELGPQASMKIDENVNRLFMAADKERQALEDDYISTGALFLAAFSSEIEATSKLLNSFGLNYQQTLKAIQSIRGHIKISQRDGESRQSTLDQYTTDITALARRGMLDPVVGRAEEINRVIEIISRRKKNNPLLIGEPGVGKTVIVEGLAQQIVSGDVPEYLLNRRVLSLEMGTLIAGAKIQGEFEERLKTIRDEVIAAAGDVILFIDEIHTVVGAGRSSGGLDASNMLKPALAKGQMQCIGATTYKEYKQYIEKDKALERRFQTVKISEPTIEQTIGILKGLRKKYEAHHHIEYTESALKAAAELSGRYIMDRLLPDKAIDLMDEAGAAKRLKVVTTPPELKELEISRNQLLGKKSEAFQNQEFEKMANIQMELASIEARIAEVREKNIKLSSEKDRIIDQDDIAKIVSRITGIPVTKMVAEEAVKLINLEERLRARVIGQEQAVSTVAHAIRRNRSGLRKQGRPIASFLFLGPTGVGKTELAKAIAAEVLDDENRIIRLDMSEFMERHNVARMIGSPPGYVGYGEGGQLTEKVRQQPYSVVLLDEFEKAHPDVFNLLLQVLDEGWLTDAEGQRVSFQNCIIIGTSNIGSHILTDQKLPVGLGTKDSLMTKREEEHEVMKEVKNFLRPEFINRLDDIIIFNRLRAEELTKIIELQIADLRQRLELMDLRLNFSENAKKFIIESIDTMSYGARPLRRKLEQTVENEVAQLLINLGEKRKDRTIHIDVVDKKLQVNVA